MANAEKTAAVAEIRDKFTGSSAAVLTEYRGLSVKELGELRRALGGGTSYAVVKNTLTKIAARDAGVEGLDDLLQGPTAVAFVEGDPVEAAKGLRDFARTHPLLVIKGGVLDGRPLSVDDIRRLADLESREVLLAKLAGAMKGSLSQAVGLFAAPLAQVARLAEALRQQREDAGEVLEAPTADTAGVEVPASGAAGADVPPAGVTGAEVSVADATGAEAPAVDPTPVAEAPSGADGPADAGAEVGAQDAPTPGTEEGSAPAAV